MQVELSQEGQILRIRFDRPMPPTDNRQSQGEGRSECFLEMPEDWKLSETHPDLVGLAVVLLVNTSAIRSITLSQPVSQAFADKVETAAGLCIQPVDGSIFPRKCPSNGRPGLAFSGGVDSTAAMLLMEEDTPLIYLRRDVPARATTQYRTEGGMKACAEKSARGREVHVVPSDLEFLRRPVGFMTDWSCGSPAVLLADDLALDALAIGINLTDAYGVSKQGFLPPSGNPIYIRWMPLFSAAGLPLHLPTAGLSAAATARLVARTPRQESVCSCVRGEEGTPCMACPKCFRKEAIWARAKGGSLRNSDIDAMLKARKIRLHLRQRPIPYTHDFAYVCAHYRGANRLMFLLRGAVRGRSRDMAWMEKWYSPSAELLTRRYQADTVKKILHSLQPMSEAETHSLRTWDAPGNVTVFRRELFAWLLRRSLNPPRAVRYVRAARRKVARLWRKGEKP